MSEKELVISFGPQLHTDVQRSIPFKEGMSLYHVLQKEGIALSAPCAGNGTCGACKIKVLEGSLPVTSRDAQLLDEAQLKDGWRLACQAYPRESCGIYIPTEQFSVVTEYSDDGKNAGTLSQEETYAIAIDLGTTTLAYELFSLKTGTTIQMFSSTNPQRIYGADVVSRMEQSDNGRRDMLKNTLRQGMRKDIGALTVGIAHEKIQSIAISGNTAMVHLFMGYSCEGLGRYPFTPVTLDSICMNAQQAGLMDEAVSVLVMPGISAYVGGDILTGLACQRILSEQKPCLFLDLGTNAEMALSDGYGKIYVTSAPAGPAFEAANISCGVGSVEGAVSSICIQNGRQILTTIGEKEIVGFCGSGILEAVYELLKNNFIDESGLLTDKYFDTDFPVGKLRITQQDIRQIQLAKSAVFSAIHILMKKAGVSVSDIDKVFLAGGFGYHLNVEKAVGIGLLPEEFTDKIQTVGNTSLYGAKEILQKRIAEEQLLSIKAVCEEIYLSNENDFQKIFMKNMNFS